MNKNEFYKQLLESYTVDKEKIKCSAKRAAKRSSFTSGAKWLGFAGAAVVALGVGAVSLSSLFGGGNAVIESGTDPEAALARIQAAEANYLAMTDSEAAHADFYVSFSKPVTYNEMTMAFSAISEPGEISCLLVYTADGSRIGPSAEGFVYTENITGVKISAPVGLYKDIQQLRTVSLVEFSADVASDEDFEPLVTEKPPVAPPDVSEPADTLQITLPEPVTEPVTTTPEDTSSDISGEQSSDTSVDQTSDSQSLPREPLTLELPVQNAVSAQFIGENELVLLGTDSVQLIRISDDGTAFTPDTTYYAASPRISWKNGSGTQLLITACDQNGSRTRLYYADGAGRILTELDISAITSNSELTGLYSNESEGTVVLRTTSNENARIYVAARNSGTLTIAQAVSSNKPLTVLSYNGGSLYYAETDLEAGMINVFCRKDGAEAAQMTASFSAEAKFTRSPSMDAFAVYDTDPYGNKCTFIYKNGEAVPVTAQGEITFSDLNSSVFCDESGWYCLTAAGTVSISKEAAAVYSFVEAGSDSFVCEISQDGTARLLKK